MDVGSCCICVRSTVKDAVAKCIATSRRSVTRPQLDSSGIPDGKKSTHLFNLITQEWIELRDCRRWLYTLDWEWLYWLNAQSLMALLDITIERIIVCRVQFWLFFSFLHLPASTLTVSTSPTSSAFCFLFSSSCFQRGGIIAWLNVVQPPLICHIFVEMPQYHTSSAHSAHDRHVKDAGTQVYQSFR